MDSKKLAFVCRELADEKKAENIVLLDLRRLSSVTDYFLICTGMSEPHLRAIIGRITEGLRKDHGIRPRAIDGTFQAGWVVMDYADVIVHVMRAEQRERYDLESLWGDAPKLRRARTNVVKSPRPSSWNDGPGLAHLHD